MHYCSRQNLFAAHAETIGLNLRVRQLLSIQRSKLHILIDNNEHITNKFDKISLLVSNKKIMFTVHNLIVSIVDSLEFLETW